MRRRHQLQSHNADHPAINYIINTKSHKTVCTNGHCRENGGSGDADHHVIHHGDRHVVHHGDRHGDRHGSHHENHREEHHGSSNHHHSKGQDAGTFFFLLLECTKYIIFLLHRTNIIDMTSSAIESTVILVQFFRKQPS